MKTDNSTRATQADIARQRPLFSERAFACPHCHAFAQQTWFDVGAKSGEPPNFGVPTVHGHVRIDPLIAALGNFQGAPVQDLHLTQCMACKKFAVWIQQGVFWPQSTIGTPQPSEDMPDAVSADFIEAAMIFQQSPRAAAALLRLALEKLCQYLGKSGSINNMIGELVNDGLDKRLQRAFDFVRVVGNEVVHPGEINVKDNPETVGALFKILNMIVEKMISDPRMVDELYESLPPSKLQGISNRDRQKTQT